MRTKGNLLGYLGRVAGAKRKYYTVWVGARPGVYDNWSDASAQVTAFPGAKYKSFSTRDAAERALARGPVQDAQARGIAARKQSAPVARTTRAAGVVHPSLSVDAACSGNPGKLEYQGVDTATAERIFHREFTLGTNNIGEFLGLVHGLAWCEQQQLPDLPIYSDSKIAIGWVKKGQCRTKLARGPKTERLFTFIDRAEAYLAKHKLTNPLLKWETKRWGEIPADFGRK